MDSDQQSRLFYRDSSKEVVVVRKGLEIARYRTSRELIEIHMKGMLAAKELTLKQMSILHGISSGVD